EYPLRRARISAGYGTLDCFRSMGTVDLFNFTGHGRRLEIRARAAQLGVGDPTDFGFERGVCPMLAQEDTSRLKLNYNLAATFHEPLLAWERTTAMATIYAERHTEFGAYLREAVGGEIALTYQMAPETPLRLSYSIAYGRTIATPATFCALLDVCLLEDQRIFRDKLRRSVLALAIARDRTNSIVDPTRGSAVVGELRWSPRALGSDRFMRFARLSAGFKAHHPLGANGATAGRVFSWRLAAGVIFAPTEQLAGGPRVYAPPEERLYAGGSTTVRGFSENQLGPVVHVLQSDSTIRSSATGGTLMGLANAEVRVPFRLFGLRLFGALFVDAGVVGERASATLDDWRVTPGVGLRMASMLGPIRLDVGYNPHPPRAGPLYQLVGTELRLVQDDFRPALDFWDRLRLHLSIGQAF
ncbi:MAG: BamA/TamA family outer membrane protein, partial [Gemmatimonadales bacterium]